jgi:hypothetical protein
MIWIYLALVLAGLVITIRLARQRSRHAYTAGTGVLLAILAVFAGFSIGFLVAAVAALLVVVAASALKRRDHVA